MEIIDEAFLQLIQLKILILCIFVLNQCALNTAFFGDLNKYILKIRADAVYAMYFLEAAHQIAPQKSQKTKKAKFFYF